MRGNPLGGGSRPPPFKPTSTGAPGWLSQPSIQLLVSALVMTSRNRAPREAPCWEWSLLKILSLPLPPPLPLALTPFSALKKRHTKEQNPSSTSFISFMRVIFVFYWRKGLLSSHFPKTANAIYVPTLLSYHCPNTPPQTSVT